MEYKFMDKVLLGQKKAIYIGVSNGVSTYKGYSLIKFVKGNGWPYRTNCSAGMTESLHNRINILGDNKYYWWVLTLDLKRMP